MGTGQVANSETTCQLYLIVSPGSGAREALAAALMVAPVASVLIQPAEGRTLDAEGAKPLVDLAQKHNAAALILDDAQLARTLRADGVHVSAAKDVKGRFEAAREIVGRGAIVGADPGISRHDAMDLAEAGADYIAFGAPASLKDRGKGREKRDELLAWWAEIFQIPCVAFDVETIAEAGTIAHDGIDFVSLQLPAAMTPAAIETLVRTASDAISGTVHA
jgi:thiamine-phosphate pyrophosphorylase